jgi:2-methylisocitrate lyase-like PEP mutase family enzyme
MDAPADAAERLRAPHRWGDLLVLPNAWEAASARRFERLGYPAVATTSAGVAEAIGHAGGEHAPPEAMFAAVARSDTPSASGRSRPPVARQAWTWW